MTAYFTRAKHPDLPEAVVPLDAVESYPGWTAVGEPADNPDVLLAAIERERMIASLDAPAVAPTPPPASPAPTPSASKSGADTSSSAPAGADPKE